MSKPASHIAAESGRQSAHYEQPLSERMRTFLRLEFLYQHMLFNLEGEAGSSTRTTITTLLEIAAILSRGDVRSEVHKELDHQIGILQRYQSQPGVDSGRLEAVIRNLQENRAQINQAGTSFLQPLKECEFLNAIKHRTAIPGGNPGSRRYISWSDDCVMGERR